MKAIGWTFLLVAGLGGALYFGGYIGGEAKVHTTEKGRATFNSGIKSAQDGLNHLKVSSEDSVKVDSSK